MIAILITALTCQILSDDAKAISAGEEIRHRANLQIMGMQNVPYDVADVLNGSNYTVLEATRIAAAKSAERRRLMRASDRAIEAQNRKGQAQMLKTMTTIRKSFDDIAAGRLVVVPEARAEKRGLIRRMIVTAEESMTLPGTSRAYKASVKAYIRSAEAALKKLEE